MGVELQLVLGAAGSGLEGPGKGCWTTQPRRREDCRSTAVFGSGIRNVVVSALERRRPAQTDDAPTTLTSAAVHVSPVYLRTPASYFYPRAFSQETRTDKVTKIRILDYAV